jgi:hypothetical protein
LARDAPRHKAAFSTGHFVVAFGARLRAMKYTVQFYRSEKLYHSKAWDLGLDAAKQHAVGMLKPYGASRSAIIDAKQKVVFAHEPSASGDAEAVDGEA